MGGVPNLCRSLVFVNVGKKFFHIKFRNGFRLEIRSLKLFPVSNVTFFDKTGLETLKKRVDYAAMPVAARKKKKKCANPEEVGCETPLPRIQYCP